MPDTIYKNGAFIEGSPLCDIPYIYQFIRTDGHLPLSLPQHIERIAATAVQIGCCHLQQPTTALEESISRLLRCNGFGSDNSHIILLRNFANGDLVLSCCGTSMYRQLSLRALHPHACIVAGCGKGDGLPTSAALASAQILREQVRAAGYGAFVAVDADQTVISVDGATPAIITQGEIVISPSASTVEAEIFFRRASDNNRNIRMHDISLADLASADELLGIDYRGITAIERCADTVYTDIIANSIAKKL